jgi:hypothetical protein
MRAVTSGVGGVFLWGAGFSVVAFAVAWFIREVPLRGSPEPAPAGSREEERSRGDESVAEPAGV